MRALRPRVVAAAAAPLLLWVAPVAVACGYPSPAQDYYEGPLNLTRMLIGNGTSTMAVRASGDAMAGAGIADDDCVLVDRSKRPRHGDIVLAVLDGELMLTRLAETPFGVALRAEGAEHAAAVTELSALEILGVATYSIHPLRQQSDPVPDLLEGPLDLAEMLVDDPAATFVVRVSGDSMTGAGICHGDEVLVDRSKRAHDGDVVVAVLDGDLTLKRLEVNPRGVVLRAENPEHADISVSELSELAVWGVATYCVHHLR